VGFAVLAAARKNLGPWLPPEHLVQDVVAAAELHAAVDPCVGLFEAIERVKRLREPPGRARQTADFPELLVQHAPLFPELGGGGGIASQELDVEGGAAHHSREQTSSTTIGQLRAHVGEERARLVEATEHRQRSGPVHAERDVSTLSCLRLVEPREQLRDRGCAEVTT